MTDKKFTMDNILIHFEVEILLKIKELLEEKHLYQSLSLDVQKYYTAIKNIEIPKDNTPAIVQEGRGFIPKDEIKRQELLKQFNIKLNSFWKFTTEANTKLCPLSKIEENRNYLKLTLPSIKISCVKCSNKIWPHNSGYSGIDYNLPEINFLEYISQDKTKIIQILFLPYQCQSCKEEPIIFIIRRENEKIKLVGRSHFEEVDVPDFIPKEEKKYYSDAIISFNCGRTLAGLFYLRTLIEQYMRRVLNEHGKISGEDLADKYSKLLDVGFPKKYTSLKVIYEELSVKIHQAKDDEKQFNKSKNDLIKHFDLLRLLPLKKSKEKT